METNSQAFSPPAPRPGQASTRHIAVDSRFAEILEEDFGIPCAVILKAVEGEPQKQAINILSWAERTCDPTYALLCWARRHGRGSYHVPREGPPGRSVDRGDCRRGYGGIGPPAALCGPSWPISEIDFDTHLANEQEEH